ncbi:hemolysin family protein [Cellulomonas sp. PhB143]|uniref:hemolysin family protein n=1 Tax=Cellulomonas sp. PhB143 TaxID=2485186 RepID=UPI000F499BE1|nr:hemolysin family protein [Cellulomonas sp. PhB143]ROS73668.1 CBS domain containing-hemolysin-like protein [Cellulomonas sp. PhB143]
MSGGLALLLLAVALVAAVLAGLLSAGEAALVRATRSGLQDAATDAEERGPAGAAMLGRVRRAQALTADPEAARQAVAAARVVLTVLAVAAVVLLLSAWLDPWLVLLVVLVGGAALAVLLVRVSPQVLGRRSPVPVLVALSGVLAGVARLTAWAVPAQEPELPATERTDREAREVADRVSGSEEFEDTERELIRSVIELGQTLTREIMVPRTDMVTIRATSSLSSALRLFERSGFSRIPVTGADTDDLVGVAFFKDVVRAVNAAVEDREGAGVTAVAWRDVPVGRLARPAMFVPESKPADELLRELQAASTHIALVVDEYGGVAGLVTIEDALEELVGELTDEHDRSGPEVEHLGGGRYRVPARLPISELGEIFDLRIEHDDVDSAGGLLAKALGKVPLPGSVAESDGLRLEAERVEGRRKQLATLVVDRLAADDAPPETADREPRGHHETRGHHEHDEHPAARRAKEDHR